MPVLPFIDLLILLGTASLTTGFVLKAINLTTRLNLTFLGVSSMDFLLAAAAFFMLVVVLAARTWVKGREPAILRAQRSEAPLSASAGRERTPEGSPTAMGEPAGSAQRGALARR